LAQRREVFEAAKQRHPERWSGDIRKLSLPDVVHLNPERESVPQAAGF
jgi:putative transposase